MNIDATKCDHCGKIHDTPNRSLYILNGSKLLSVPLKVKGKTEYLDFCGEDCLREELIKRKDASKFRLVRCAACKWWDKKPFVGVVRECKHPKCSRDSENDGSDGLDVLTQCGREAGYPFNCTGPEFGCVHGEIETINAKPTGET